jgi:hypothetical protein
MRALASLTARYPQLMKYPPCAPHRRPRPPADRPAAGVPGGCRPCSGRGPGAAGPAEGGGPQADRRRLQRARSSLGWVTSSLLFAQSAAGPDQLIPREAGRVLLNISLYVNRNRFRADRPFPPTDQTDPPSQVTSGAIWLLGGIADHILID